ncbi:MAG: 30S ribosomal protein S9 [Candidatus Bathyarchaeia archaeon]
MTDKKRLVFATGKRKTAVAKAVLKPGRGVVTINSQPVETLSPELARAKIMEPLLLAGDAAKDLNIQVTVSGGGVIGQAEACRMAVARGLAQWSRGEELRRRFTAYDRSMLAGDQRRTEAKKIGGPGPRRRRQKSYR